METLDSKKWEINGEAMHNLSYVIENKDSVISLVQGQIANPDNSTKRGFDRITGMFVCENGVKISFSDRGMDPEPDDLSSLYIFDDGKVVGVDTGQYSFNWGYRTKNEEETLELDKKLGKRYGTSEEKGIKGILNNSKNKKLIKLCEAKVAALITGAEQYLDENKKQIK